MNYKKSWPAFIIGVLLLIYLPYNIAAPKADGNNLSYHGVVKNDSRQRFILFILSNTEIVNGEIADQREGLIEAYRNFNEGLPVSFATRYWLNELALQYDVKNPDFTQENTWQTLLNRVDVVPPSLVIAQAINESSWGTSRFATEGNNYFGQWCYSAGCGLIPSQREPGQFHEVRKYPDSLASVASYINNLNTYYTYQAFRDQREAMHLAGREIDGLQLCATLSHYSQIRGAYIERISDIINQYNLVSYDRRPVEESNLYIKKEKHVVTQKTSNKKFREKPRKHHVAEQKPNQSSKTANQ
jgi:Bax protein